MGIRVNKAIGYGLVDIKTKPSKSPHGCPRSPTRGSQGTDDARTTRFDAVDNTVEILSYS